MTHGHVRVRQWRETAWREWGPRGQPSRRGAILHILNLVVLSGLASETEWKRVEGERRKDGRIGERLPQTTRDANAKGILFYFSLNVYLVWVRQAKISVDICSICPEFRVTIWSDDNDGSVLRDHVNISKEEKRTGKGD